jgi:3-oxoacyl-(acyl-carrier-protein) synthase
MSDEIKSLTVCGEKAAMILWDDAVAQTGWIDREDVMIDHASCVTVGIIIDETKDTITVVSTVRNEEDSPVFSPINIPRRCIKMISELSLTGEFS